MFGKISNIKYPILNQGQTLIETMAALVILVMGVSASVGLAVYALGTSAAIVKQIIGTGLAREGVEAVRNMRDTNWLNDTLGTYQNSVGGCYDFSSGQPDKDNCFKKWLGENGNPDLFCLNPTSGQGSNCLGGASVANYTLGFSVTQPDFWTLNRNTNKYGMTFNDPASGATWQQKGFYDNSGNVECGAGSDYCRKITITKIDNIAPYNRPTDQGPMLYIQSQVWWKDKSCPKTSLDWPGLSKCSIELDTYLTNWKNY